MHRQRGFITTHKQEVIISFSKPKIKNKMKSLILVFAAAMLMISCGNKQAEQQSAPTETPVTKTENKKVNSSDVFTEAELGIITGADNAKKGGRKNQVAPSVVLAAAAATLTNNGGGSFSINYNGETNIVWMFFRGGDSLSTVSGNVYPTASQSFYQNPVTTFTSNFTRAFYQSVVVTGSTTPDINGVVGADWVVTYSNVVNN
jgi:hypothetical protein